MIFRPGLLDGRHVAVAGAGSPASEAERTVLDRLQTLGAEVQAADPAHQAAAPDALLLLADRPFSDGGLQALLDLAWRCARDAGLHTSGRGGRLVFVGPATDGRPHGEAACAALENLARTLSVEWARFAVTAVAVAPGPGTTPGEVGDLVAYLLSDAGGYFSGCRFSLGTIRRPLRAGTPSG